MLQNLLKERFGLKYSTSASERPAYLLNATGRNSLHLDPPKDPQLEPRVVVVVTAGGNSDGQAIGVNTSMDFLAKRLSGYLNFPVVNETHIEGSFDFHLQPEDAENTDLDAAVLSMVHRLGLDLKRGRAPVLVLTIEAIASPSPN